MDCEVVYGLHDSWLPREGTVVLMLRAGVAAAVLLAVMIAFKLGMIGFCCFGCTSCQVCGLGSPRLLNPDEGEERLRVKRLPCCTERLLYLQ